MKKSLLIMALVALLATTTSTNSTATPTNLNSTNSGTKLPPEAVQASFDQLITYIMVTCFPENTAYDATGMAWDKVRDIWLCKGVVLQVNGSGSIDVYSGRFSNDGEVLDFTANVHN